VSRKREPYQLVLEQLAPIAERLSHKPTDDDVAHGWNVWKWNAAREMVEDWQSRISSSRQLLESHYGWTTRALFDLDVDTEYGVAQAMVETDVCIGEIVESHQ
jgi:hypothetical protein